MTDRKISEVAPYWSTVESFLKARASQPIDIRIANGGILKYQILGQMGRLSFEFPGSSIPASLSRWKAVQIRNSDEKIYLTTNGNSEDGGLQGVHAIIESALRINQESSTPFAESLATALRQYRKLVAAEQLNQQILLGLLGELIVFDMIRSKMGFDGALAAWHVKENSIHDFDLGKWDLEVKTTARASRIHRISSLAQMEPLENRRLFLMSVHLVEVGIEDEGSISLPQLFLQIAGIVREYSADLHQAFVERVNLVLEKADLDSDSLGGLTLPAYRQKNPPRLIEVDSLFPRITRSTISGDNIVKARISNVEYDIDCEDLGTEEFALDGEINEI